jgi:hypothetical protein
LHWPKRFSTNSTYSEALARCDAKPIVTAIESRLLKARAVEQCGSEPCRLQANQQEEVFTHVAMDGKTLRGTLGHESEGQLAVHLLSLKEWEEIVYGVTNLPRKKANASRLLAFQQAHWRIENRLHYRRDVTDSEKMPGLGPYHRCSPGFGGPQWRSPRFDGLAPRSQCGFPNAAFLRASRGSLLFTVSQAFAVERVNQKALMPE